ncbi:hypothetical protein E8E13_003760 [Curvularia kusanoi]|uniref:BTB domain-containing protein n=1 Tax=Curvularia kusanoi TaxID=90978 RepID=A0A9P4W7N9_CURKU|nr:hypothetical protein E8E13_003760 [Curvularia kusanoi]
MIEAQSRSAELQEVDPGTFIRFLEYAYRQDYTTPLPLHNSNTMDTAAPDYDAHDLSDTAPSQEPSSGWGDGWGNSWGNSTSAPSDFGALPSGRGSGKGSKKQSRYSGDARAVFNKREYLPNECGATALPATRSYLYQDASPSQSFTPVFLAHARLYTLAEMRMVLPLKTLALHRLHNTLVHFHLSPERLIDVAELARYAYEHGTDRSIDGKIDPLRDMVVNYVACEKKALGKHPEFRNLMDGGGEFAGDFWDIVSQESL